MKIRPMTLADCNYCERVESITPEPMWMDGTFEYTTKTAHWQNFVLVHDHDGIIGYFSIKTVGQLFHIAHFAVHPDYWMQGNGDFMMQSILAKAYLSGKPELTLNVRITNEGAIHLYKKHGFKVHGQQDNYYTNKDGQREHGLLMYRSIQR